MRSVAAYRPLPVAVSQRIGNADYGTRFVWQFYQERTVAREQLPLHSIIAVLIVPGSDGVDDKDGVATKVLTHYLGLFVLIVDQCISFQFPNCSDVVFRGRLIFAIQKYRLSTIVSTMPLFILRSLVYERVHGMLTPRVA
jgi:hypothetical protein